MFFRATSTCGIIRPLSLGGGGWERERRSRFRLYKNVLENSRFGTLIANIFELYKNEPFSRELSDDLKLDKKTYKQPSAVLLLSKVLPPIPLFPYLLKNSGPIVSPLFHLGVLESLQLLYNLSLKYLPFSIFSSWKWNIFWARILFFPPPPPPEFFWSAKTSPLFRHTVMW